MSKKTKSILELSKHRTNVGKYPFHLKNVNLAKSHSPFSPHSVKTNILQPRRFINDHVTLTVTEMVLTWRCYGIKNNACASELF